VVPRPEAASPYVGNTRRFLLRRFPFFVVYRVFSPMSRSSPLPMLGGDRTTGLTVEMMFMAEYSTTSTGHGDSFGQARRRALTRL
jgi:hypothetical protein